MLHQMGFANTNLNVKRIARTVLMPLHCVLVEAVLSPAECSKECSEGDLGRYGFRSLSRADGRGEQARAAYTDRGLIK